MNRPRISLERHHEAGPELKRHRDYLVKLTSDLDLRSVNRRRALTATHRALRAVDDLRAMLDSQLALDWPQEFDPSIYYPGPNAEAERAASGTRP